jgi:flagellar motor switch protein FliN/FliY
MKSFLEHWLAEAPKVFAREFSAEASLVAAEQPPLSSDGSSLAADVTGSRSGKIAVLTDRRDLHAFFVETKVTDSSLDDQRDTELWKGLLQQVAEAVSAAAGGVEISPFEESTWTLGLPLAIYHLQLGSSRVRMALADQVREIAAPAGEYQFPPAAPSSQPAAARKGVDLLMDVELEVSLRFGSREMPLGSVLELGPGDVVELDRHVAEPVDFLVGDKIVARGEVVLVNGNFGFSVVHVAEPEKRLESIRCLF